MAAEQHRYFIALVPPEPVYGEAWQWKEWFAEHYHTRKALNSPPHVTLQMPFRWREDREARLVEGLTDWAATQAAFPMTVEGFAAFPPRVVYLNTPRTEALAALQKSLVRFLRPTYGIHHDTHKDNGFVPHLTVAFRDLKKEAFQEAWAEVENKAVQLAWQQTTVSLLKHDGQRWQDYQQFALAT